MTHESTMTDVEIPENDPGISRHDSGPTASEIALLQRRDLVLQVSDHIADVLGVDVTPGMLIMLADAEEASDVRLAAVRALRCIESIGTKDSAVVAAVGEASLYHYVEGVITYGASERCFLGLMQAHNMSAEGVTGLYAVRELIAEYTNGHKPGFRFTHEALSSIGIGPQEAGADPEAAVQALYEAGYFVDHIGNSRYGKVYDHPIFAPGLSGEDFRIVKDDFDGSLTKGIIAAINTYRHPEEVED